MPESDFAPAEMKPTISYEDFAKLDIRMGTITRVDDIAGTDKLIKMTVDFGDHTRTILAGMKQEREDVQEIVGLQTMFLVNLAPRKMMGEESQGMILDIGYADKLIPVLALPEKPLPNGARVG